MFTRLRGACRSIIAWVRASYPEDAPRTGYSPLIALYGPMSLSRKQTEQVIDQLRGHPADTVSINVAITKVTGQLPHRTQTRQIARVLHKTEPDRGG